MGMIEPAIMIEVIMAGLDKQIEETVNDFFARWQSYLGITSGDVDPLLCLVMENRKQEYVDAIRAAMEYQLTSKEGE